MGVIRARLGGDLKIGAEEGGSEFGDQLLESVRPRLYRLRNPMRRMMTRQRPRRAAANKVIIL
jgi:hypothetical protein